MSDEPVVAAEEVVVERLGRAGVLTLNRPKSINALTPGMVGILAAALEAWRSDDEVTTVIIRGAGERGLCAGGDIVALYTDAKDGDGLASASFWRDEYALNATIDSYPKPIVAIQDGIVLGGGIGVSAHASHRVVTERSRLGFPEVTIGFVPDVGATWLLSRAPGELGTRLALSAEQVQAADAITVGFSDSFVPSRSLPDLYLALETESANAALARFACTPPAGTLEQARDWIDEAFSADTISEIVERLRISSSDDAHVLAEVIEAKSPTALAVTLSSLRKARSATNLRQALITEFRVSRHATTTPDFVEGIRAQVIDKDRSPRWNPSTVAQVTDGDVAAFFEPPSDGDLSFPSPPEESA